MKSLFLNLLYIEVDGIRADVYMGINSGLELNNDIQYVKKVFDKYSTTFKIIKRNLTHKNKIFASRFYFIVFQFRNIFDSTNWI